MTIPDKTTMKSFAGGDTAPLIDIQNLTTTIQLHKASFNPVENVSLHVNRAEVLGLVGESGCGKSTTVLSLLRLVPPGTRLSGRVLIGGKNLLDVSDAEIRRVRGKDISMIFQEPMTALDPA